jgi:uncharacterized protein YdhG (YjbR/CyaY superfamily)
MANPKTVNEYIGGFPTDVRKRLREVRQTIRKAAPKAKETIKYQIPTYVLDGNLVFFAGFKHHIAVYPVPQATGDLKKQLEPYRAHKSTLQFPLEKPMPLPVIRKVVRELVKEREQKITRSKK